MRELTVRETEEIAGGWGLPGAGIGGGTGAAIYLGHASTSGVFTWRGFGRAIFEGAALGAISGPVGVIRAYFLPRAGFVLGAGFGL